MKLSKFTAIVSDMHLCEAEPTNLKFPLWKKFKTRQFFFDDVFTDFLRHIRERANGHPVELVMNGDIFDFDSVLTLPDEPYFSISWLERRRGLCPRPERSRFKIEVILKDHKVFVESLREFVLQGNDVIFVMGNHDLEMHFPVVQETIREHLGLSEEFQKHVRFVEWFYISNQDTMIEHGNQYDPYCVCEDPINPFIQGYNYKSIKLPFGNQACRYIMNGMGFFNPHVDTNYIMSLGQYIDFFIRYMLRAQPLLLITWFWGAVVTLWKTFQDSLHVPIREPLRVEVRVNEIAEKANAEPRMVRELKELFAAPAGYSPLLLARELWLDRAFLIFMSFFIIFELMIVLRNLYDVSFFWAFIPLFLLLPFFLFYSQSITSLVSSYKEPDERTLAMASAITNVRRIVYGHTHRIRHEMIGAVEHLNSGCWSPAFLDVECTKSIDQKTFVWLEPSEEGGTQGRRAQLLIFKDGKASDALRRSSSSHP
jgi:UDP-2,3-diacylglucosamine pyrophosphatase LpxH